MCTVVSHISALLLKQVSRLALVFNGTNFFPLNSGLNDICVTDNYLYHNNVCCKVYDCHANKLCKWMAL